MNALSLITNPGVRSILPLVGEVADALGFANADQGDVGKLVDKVRSWLPGIKILRELNPMDATVSDISSLLKSAGLNMRDSDVQLWIDEIQSFADSSDENLKQFFTGPNGMRMLKSVLTRSNSAREVETTEVPAYDPVSGIFHFE